jgi:phage minor structural protein
MNITEIEAADLTSQLGQETIVSYEAEDATVDTIVTALLALQSLSPAVTKGTISASYTSLTRSIKVDGDTILRALYRLRDTVGGYLYVDNDRALQWASTIGEDKGQQIRYRKNLIGIERTIEYSQLCNKLYAYGSGEGSEARIKLSDADGQSEDYVEDTDSQTDWGGVYQKTFVEKSITHPNTLLAWANLKLAELKDPPITYRVDTLDLSQSMDYSFSFDALQLGSTVQVIDEDLGIDVSVQVVQIEHPDMLHPENMVIELANRTTDIADAILDVYDRQQFDSHVATIIGAGQVTINGTLAITDWISDGQTTINGAKITTGTVTLSQLNFVPLSSSGDTDDIIATINASAEGITISANKIDITVGKSIFQEGPTPTSLHVGDLWFNSADGNKCYRAASIGANEIKAGEWVLARDSGIATNAAAISVNAENILLRVAKNDVINQINISTEGITIDGDNIEINGDTTFSATSPAVIDIIEYLASNANSGQKNVVLSSAGAAARYSAGDIVYLGDDSNSETAEIDSIASATLTMVDNLTNSYTTAANAKVILYGAANNINNGVTTISGGMITTGTITAAKMNVSELSAIVADLGTINAGDIRLGSGTVGSNFTGIRIYEDGLGTYRVAGINNEVLQAYFDSDGIFKAGAGSVTIDATGTHFEGNIVEFTSGANTGYVFQLLESLNVWGEEKILFGIGSPTLKGLLFNDDRLTPYACAPSTPNAYDLGTSAAPFGDIYGTNIDLASGGGAIDGAALAIEGTTSVAVTAPAGQLTLGGAAITQGLKAYSLDTVYENTSGKLRLVAITTRADDANDYLMAIVYCDATDGKTTIIGSMRGKVDSGSNPNYDSFTFVVPPGYYYKVANSLNAVLVYWTEWDLF